MKDVKKNLLTRIIDEYKKVTWAKPREVVQVTIIVLLITAFVTVVVIGFDYIFNFLLNSITSILRSVIK